VINLKQYIEYARKAFLCLSGAIIGIFIFLSFSTTLLNYNVFSPTFHEKLFVKYDIYSGTAYVLDNSISKFIAYVKEASPDSYAQQKDAFDMLEQTTSKETITNSLNYLREGIYEYLSDQRKFLPDIILKASTSSDTSSSGTNSFANISKVNLGAVLMYANRNDIVDYLAIIKVIYYFASKLANLILPLQLLISILSFIAVGNFKQLFKWLLIIFGTTAVLFFITAAGLLIYIYLLLPGNIDPITVTLSMDSKPVLSYIRDCVKPTIFFDLITAGISAIAIFALKKYLVPNKFTALEKNDVSTSPTRKKVYQVIEVSIIAFIVVSLSSSLYLRVDNIAKYAKDNDFASVFYKMRGVETMSEVIPAKDDFIHDVQIKVVDSKTEQPVKGLRVDISGKNDDNGKNYVDSKKLDDVGQAKFGLDKGFFRLMFYSPSFPSDKYKLPSPVFFQLDTPGTKVLTVSLEPVQQTQTKSGFAEIEILDEDNKPVQGAELQVSSTVDATGHPDMVSAVSNSQGIAVFKVGEGSYKVKFNSSKLPVKYTLPDEFAIDVKADKTSRYTIKLTVK
jgi:hypothetical protein